MQFYYYTLNDFSEMLAESHQTKMNIPVNSLTTTEYELFQSPFHTFQGNY